MEDEYRRAKQNYYEARDKARAESFKSFLEGISQYDTWRTAYRVMKLDCRPQPETIKVGDKVANSAADSAYLLADHFYGAEPPDCRRNLIIRQLVDQLAQEIRPQDPEFTVDEIKYAINSFNGMKSPGSDHFTADIIQNAYSVNHDIFHKLYNACLRLQYFPHAWKIAETIVIPKPGKTDYSQASSLRPIGLLSIMGKVLEKLFTRRLMHQFCNQGNYSENQYGFTPQRSAIDALDELVRRIETRDMDHMLLVQLDIKGAFDGAWWPFIKYQLLRYGCPRNVYELICSYLSERRVNVHYAGTAYSKSIVKGCIQGSVCGPFFWNLIVNDLLEIDFGPGVHVQAFADDITFLIAAPSCQKAETKASEVLRIVSEWGEKTKLAFSQEKTSIVHFSGGRCFRNVQVEFSNMTLGTVDEVKILGVVVDKHLKFTRHIEHVVKKATKVLHAVYKIVSPKWGCSPEVCRQIYLGAVEPLILYGCSVWARALCLKANKRRIARLQRQFLLRIAKAYRTVSYNSLYVITDVLPLDLKIWELSNFIYYRRKGHLPRNRAIPLDVPRPFYTLRHPSRRSSLDVMISEEEDQDTDGLRIYTDGSKIESGVGCAYVSYVGSTEQCSELFRLGAECSVFQAELLAIERALIYLSDNLSGQILVRLYSDSQSALHAISDLNSTNFLVASIQERLSTLLERGLRVCLRWTRAHIGTLGNERADALAKAAANSQLPVSYHRVPLSFLKRELRIKALAEWEERYRSETTGGVTKAFFPSVMNRRAFPNSLLSFTMTQALTGHGAFAAYLKRFGLKENDACPCDSFSSQDVKHLFTECGYTFQERQTLEHICQRYGLHSWPITLIKPVIPTVVRVVNHIMNRILPVING